MIDTSNYKEMARSLSGYFAYEDYIEGIKKIKHDVQTNLREKRMWLSFKNAVARRLLQDGEPLLFVNKYANHRLKDNTDEEAYVWLDMMIHNVERNDGIVEQYPLPKFDFDFDKTTIAKLKKDGFVNIPLKKDHKD